MFKFVLHILLCCAAALPSEAQSPEGDDLVVVHGVARDKATKNKIENVSIFVSGTNIGTVSNADGTFSLKIPTEYAPNTIKAEHIGYLTDVTPINELIKNKGNITIWLTPASRLLQEAVIYGGPAREIVEKAIGKIPVCYAHSKSLFNAFYRETIQKGRRYVGVAEAMVDVFKTPYQHRVIDGERVQVKKGRKLVSQNSRDTLAVKIVGGPTSPITLDFVKNSDFLFGHDDLDYYSFSLEKPVTFGNRMQYVVRFVPCVRLEYALCTGLLYIDQESLAFSRAEFGLDMSDEEKATKAILWKKPGGLHFRPQEVAYTITYKMIDGLSYLNYVRTKMRFQCDWKKRLFYSDFTTDSEMVMVDRTDNPETNISRKAAFGHSEIFDDQVENYWDSDFWKAYNIIEPTESLEKAITKLKKKGHTDGF